SFARFVMRERRPEVRLVELRPELRREVELRVSGAPEQKIAEPLFSSRADEEIDLPDRHRRQASVEEGLVDGLRVERARGRLPRERARRVDELLATTVRERQRERHRRLARRLPRELLESLTDTRREAIDAADRPELDLVLEELLALIHEKFEQEL